MKKKYIGYLITETDVDTGEFVQTRKKYLGETCAVSKLKAINNFRYRIGKPSYNKMYDRGYADATIDYHIEVVEEQ